MTGQDVAVRPAAVTPLADKVQYARLLAASGMLPAQYRGKPENLLWAVEYGQMLGLSPMAAITGVHVIEGKPTASAGLISALVRRAGHRLRVTGNDQRALVQIIRHDDPDFTFESEWTIDRARQAGLTGKKVWQQYPAAMLKARAIAECARDAAEDALSGVHYTPEELGAEVTEDGAAMVTRSGEFVPDGPVEQVDEPPLRPAPAEGEVDEGVVDAELVHEAIAEGARLSQADVAQGLAGEAVAAGSVDELRDVYDRAKAARVLTVKVDHDGRSPSLSALITERKAYLHGQAERSVHAAESGETPTSDDPQRSNDPAGDQDGVLL